MKIAGYTVTTTVLVHVVFLCALSGACLIWLGTSGRAAVNGGSSPIGLCVLGSLLCAVSAVAMGKLLHQVCISEVHAISSTLGISSSEGLGSSTTELQVSRHELQC